MRNVSRVCAALLWLGWLLAPASGQQLTGASNHLIFEATQPIPAPETEFLHLGGTSPKGHAIAVNSQYLVLDGKPWLPVMGEFHFSRYPEQSWEEEILKMKAAGIQIVSTYIFWIHHEEIEGQFDWTGQRDLRKFVELCARHDMYVYLRIGPWVHGEARNGGFPDWLLTKTKNLRRNDPIYLEYVRGFDEEIAKQVQGLLWKDGGPILGVQLENEYPLVGPGAGTEHIQRLKDIAVEAGLTTPLYSVTSWPNFHFPEHEMIPVAGGYPDGFWSNSLTMSPPKDVYKFQFDRSIGDMGAMSHGTSSSGAADPRHYPFATAESGGGMETAYHRRPLIRSEDIASLTLAAIGSGVALHGYYVFQGGANPDGKLTSLQESQATGYPNDLPVVSYDFQAPLSQYGEPRKTYFELKELNLFLNEFGSDLAPMMPVGPTRRPTDASDTSLPRAAIRVKDSRGFLFVNNYIRQYPMPERKDFQVTVHLAGATLQIPEKPITIPPNSYFIWPFNLRLGGVELIYSTAQLLTKVSDEGETTFFFMAVPGVEPEFLFNGSTTRRVSVEHARIDRTGRYVRISEMHSGRSSALKVIDQSGGKAILILLSEPEAEQLWKLDIAGKMRAAFSEAIPLAYSAHRLTLESVEPAKMNIAIYEPTPESLHCGLFDSGLCKQQHEGSWTSYYASVPAYVPAYTFEKTQNAGPRPPVRMGKARNPPVAEIPAEETFHAAAMWKFMLLKEPPSGIRELYLRISYTGDIARAYAGEHMIDDNFYNGTQWTIGLERFLPLLKDSPITLKVLPIERTMPLYLDAAALDRLPKYGPVAAVQQVSVVPEYCATFELRAR